MWFRIGSGVVFEFPDWFWTGFIFSGFCNKCSAPGKLLESIGTTRMFTKAICKPGRRRQCSQIFKPGGYGEDMACRPMQQEGLPSDTFDEDYPKDCL
jgi:hypothetical protein